MVAYWSRQNSPPPNKDFTFHLLHICVMGVTNSLKLRGAKKKQQKKTP